MPIKRQVAANRTCRAMTKAGRPCACGAQIFRRTSELIENAGQSGSSANGRNSAVTSRSDTLNSMDRDRLGTNTIRHNAQWAAILLPHPCRL